MDIEDPKAGFVLKLLNEVTDEANDNVDLEVTLAGGERYTATFATLENVHALLKIYKTTGECLSGRYIWMRNLVMIEDLQPESIHMVVQDMLKSGELFGAFGGPHDT